MSETVETWVRNYLQCRDLAHKLEPGPVPRGWAEPRPAACRLEGPGRPPELEVLDKTPRSIRQKEVGSPRKRAELFHRFLHHELQAAELMCWAILAFPETPPAFRKGLLGICLDEIRHMQLYQAYLQDLGFGFGDFPVRDWFWLRVSTCETPLQFVALMGIGLEGGNLDHTRRFEGWLRALGDEEGAELQALVGREEVPHVRFAIRWFREWSGELSFEDWRQALVPPLTPSLLRGKPLDREARREAGLSDAFLEELEAWSN